MRNTRWIYRQKNSLGSHLNIDRDILTLLESREIDGDKKIYDFINTDLENISSPFLLKDVDIAVERILKARDKNENIWIYGDYDVDGITSTSLCYLALSEIGITPNFYIPLRDEGYGLNKEAIEQIKNEGGDVIITVDCGISSHCEIEFANSIGLDIIVTDHHEINSGNPPALAVINPKREDNLFHINYLAGVGTAFMLMYGLYEKLGKKEDIYKYLDIVAIGTVADIVPLLEENRIFTKFGMEQLKHSNWIGIKMLIQKLFEDLPTKKFTTYDIGFIIAPIFNAAGRLEDAKKAVFLFIEKDKQKCIQIINSLIENNSHRKEIQQEIFESAISIIEDEKLSENSSIVVARENFHHGVIGIVASKILDRYYKPTVIMEIKPEEGIATASCRSIEGFSIIEALNSMKEIFVKYGGHSGAAGFSIEIDKIPLFTQKLNEYAKKELSESSLIKPVKLDLALPIYKISYDFIDKISTLEPFGFGNPSPIFALKNCKISGIRAIGKEKNHTMLNIEKDSIEIRNCVWFGSDDVFSDLLMLKNVDVAFKLKLETYKERYQYKIYIEDIQPASSKSNEYEELYNLHSTVFPIETVVYTRKKIEGANLSLAFLEEGVDVAYGRNYLASLDSQTSHLLMELHKNYGYDFDTTIKDIITTDEHYKVHIVIDKKLAFSSYSLKQGEIFKDIKKFLLGNFSYNSLQKKALSSIFKENKNTLIVAQKNRGINTIILTTAIYYKAMDKKLLYITKGDVPKKIRYFCEISSSFKEGYDFYISDEFLEELRSKKSLVLSFKDIDIANFNKIVDSYSIPKNIIFMEEDEIIHKKNIFANFLPISKRVQILKGINSYETLFATKDILRYL